MEILGLRHPKVLSKARHALIMNGFCITGRVLNPKDRGKSLSYMGDTGRFA